MRIVLTGGTGFIGRALCASLVRDGHQVSVLTRNAQSASELLGPLVAAVEWNGRDGGSWERSLERADAVINLAGAPIADARWTVARKQLLVDSRVLTTRLIVAAMSRRLSRPGILISASGIGYYGASDDHVLEEGAPEGRGFLADLCVAWEAEALRAAEFETRVVLLRTGLVLERDGGALSKMLLPFRLFVGGPIMPGTQWVSWIHRLDHIRLIRWALADRSLSGPLNAVAPYPVTMNEFCATLGRILRRPSWLPVPEFVVTVALGELGSLLTTGQRVTPAKAIAGGFAFQYPALDAALEAICSRTAGKSRAA